LGEPLPQEPALDSVQHYLQEIGRVSLLSASEEVELAEAMLDCASRIRQSSRRAREWPGNAERRRMD